MMTRVCPVAVLVALFAGGSALAADTPRDEVLRVAPSDAALLVVVQNAREHVRNVLESPFGKWFPSTAVGKQLLASGELKQFHESATMIAGHLGTTPEAILDDILGDAVAFAFSPAPPDRPNDERAVILIRPRKVETLTKLLDTLNTHQTRSGELKAVVRKEHAGGAYFERQKTAGGSEFYCFRGAVFAFAGTESDIKAVIDRDKAATGVPELLTRMQKLGVADAAAVLLVNPRPLDAEVKARVAAAKPDEQRLLARFAEVWAALDSAAVYAALDTNLELGVSLRFTPGKLPADAKKWLVGPRDWGNPAALIPGDALFGVAAHVRAVELIELVASLAPVPPGKPGVKEWIEQTLGPAVGRDKLPLVLGSLGPDWAVWAEPPAKDAFLPTLVAAVQITGEGEDRANAERALVRGIETGFLMARLAYNAKHTDQIEIKEEKDAATGVTISSLVNEKGFPPGFRPSFALTHGYLVVATSPEAIKRFRAPTAKPQPGGTTVAKLSGVRCREYFQTHGPKLAKFLADLGAGDEKSLREQFEMLSAALELLDSAEVAVHDIENGVRIALLVKPAKPLKK